MPECNPKDLTKFDLQIADNLKNLRLCSGLSQAHIAEAIGVTFQQVQKYENGTGRITSGRLAEIAMVLDVPIVALFAGLDLPDAMPVAEPAIPVRMLLRAKGVYTLSGPAREILENARA